MREFNSRLRFGGVCLFYRGTMGEVKDNEVYEEELLDYEEEEEKAPDSVNGKPAGESVKK